VKTLAVASGSATPPPPTVFKPIGYVEKAGGQVEAIIVQENEVEVVHTGDLIAGRYRVTKISPDAVETADESLAQSNMIKPNGVEASNSIGYVQKADGKVETVVAEADTVRLVPETPTVAVAQAGPAQPVQKSGVTEQASAAPTPVPSALHAATVSNVEHPEGVAEEPVVRQASFQVTTPLAELSAPDASKAGPAIRSVGAQDEGGDGAISLAAATPEGPAGQAKESLVRMKPLGYVVSAEGQFTAIISCGDDVDLVRQGDLFGGRYRAVAVSAEAVDAVEEPPRQLLPARDPNAPAFADVLSASAETGTGLSFGDESLTALANASVELPPKIPDGPLIEKAIPPPKEGTGPPVTATTARSLGRETAGHAEGTAKSLEPATLIFHTLGYVETEDEGFKAVVADGAEVYLVGQGETFAGQYRATSVEPSIVLAVKAPPGQDSRNSLSAQTESGGKSASKTLYGYLHFSLANLANAPSAHEVDAASSPFLMDQGLNLFNPSVNRF
jgi:hypothetical protein